MVHRGLDSEAVVRLLDGGMTQAQVAEEMGVTRQDVQYHVKKTGWRSPLKIAMEQMPWKNLTDEEKQATPYQRLRMHLEYTATSGEHMRGSKLRRLRDWYENKIIEFDTVVEYDPTIPPLPNQKFGSWHYVPRTERDGDLIVRQNAYTVLNDEQKVWFRLPKRLPDL